MQIKKLSTNAQLPTRASEHAAGYDLYANIEEPITIASNQTVLVPTGIAMAIPEDYFLAIYARSGLAVKNGIRPANCTGIIDADYRGEIMVALHNDNDEDFVVEPNMRIAQGIFQKYQIVEFEIVDQLSETKRGSGGFGSTGVI